MPVTVVFNDCTDREKHVQVSGNLLKHACITCRSRARDSTMAQLVTGPAPHQKTSWSLAKLLRDRSLNLLLVDARMAARQERARYFGRGERLHSTYRCLRSFIERKCCHRARSLSRAGDSESQLLYLRVVTTPDTELLASLVCLRVFIVSDDHVIQLPSSISTLAALQLLSLQRLPDKIVSASSLPCGC